MKMMKAKCAEQQWGWVGKKNDLEPSEKVKPCSHSLSLLSC